MRKWTLFLLTCLMAACGGREIRCDGHLTAINPPVAQEARPPRGPEDAR
jgi:hypothetical protein